MPTVREIALALEEWAPPASKFDYDNVGLQVGHSDRQVQNVLVAFDLTSAVIDEAETRGAELIVTHHPLFFKAQKRLVGDDLIGALALRLAEKGTAYYAIHTNLDVAHGGVSFGLAEKLGLENIRFLKLEEGTLVKLVVFVPETHAEAVRNAAADAGAGQIGEYSSCSFETRGTGRFRPGIAADPHIGETGGPVESVEEVRLEVEVLRWDLNRVLASVRLVHPYEEVAYDVFPMENTASRIGSGAIGTLASTVSLSTFLETVAKRLDAASIRYSGDPDRSISTVAVCGGSGSSLIGVAMSQGADAFVTGDVGYHRFFEALDAEHKQRMALIDPGHFETERHTEQQIVDYLKPRFGSVTIHRTKVRTSEMKTFSRG